MAANAILALDIGTSTVRALVGTTAGGVLGLAQAPTPIRVLDASNPLAREFDPDQVFRLLGRLVRHALRTANLDSSQVEAIGITSQRQGVVFLDESGKELYAGPNMDLRAAMEGAAIDEELGPEIYETTGHLPSIMYAPARLRWFRQHDPSACDRMSGILTIAGWLAYRLTGVKCCEPALAGEAGLLDVGQRVRCDDLLKRLGIKAHLLPPLVKAGMPVGGLRQRIARTWDLRTNTPVTLAGPDTQCGLVGMGAVEPGMTGLVAGWSCTVQTVTGKPRWDREKHTWVGCMPTEERWIVESNMGDGGNAYRWLVATLIQGSKAYEKAEVLVSKTPSGSDGALAFLGPGPVSMASAGLRPGGFLFYTPMSFQEVSKGQLLRAALENVAYSAKANIEALEGVTGQHLEAIHLGGGLSRSGTFVSLLANVLGREVCHSVLPEVSTWGALLAGAVSAGQHTHLEEAAKKGHCQCHVLEPSPAESAEYQEHYHRWREAYHAMQEVE